MLRLIEYREVCAKCQDPAVSVCPKCGVLCRRHDQYHRHETGHITQELNWRAMDQPIIPKQQNNTFCNKHLKDVDQHTAIELLDDEPEDYLNNRRTD